MMLRRRVSPVGRFLALTSFLACNPGAEPPAARATLAIEEVSVIPMDGERVLTGVTVLIGGGRVLAVQPSADAEVTDDAVRVDARGRFRLCLALCPA